MLRQTMTSRNTSFSIGTLTGVSGRDLTGLSGCMRDLTGVSGRNVSGLTGLTGLSGRAGLSGCDLTGLTGCVRDLLFGINWLLLWKPESIILIINA